MQTDQGRSMECPPLVVGRCLKVLEQERLEQLGAVEIGSDDGEEAPALLARVLEGKNSLG